MKVWIDLANSPHAPLFAPVARRLIALGHDVLFTVRDHAQTLELARAQGIEPVVVGGSSPGAWVSKAQAIAMRALELRAVARATRPDVALSHNSYAQILAASSLSIRIVTAMDFEHQPSNHLAFRLAQTILLPEAIAPCDVRRQGGRSNKLRFYPGYKEDIYLGDFEPDPEILAHVGIKRTPGTVVVVTRTPPSRALYHRRRNDLYLEALTALGRQPQVRCVALVRHAEQRAVLAGLALPNLVIPDAAVDARSLMYASDLVLGGGGTMTREAALLGIPTYSVFAGRRPAVDRALEQSGALCWLISPEDLRAVAPRPFEPKAIVELRQRSRAALEYFIGATLYCG